MQIYVSTRKYEPICCMPCRKLLWHCHLKHSGIQLQSLFLHAQVHCSRINLIGTENNHFHITFICMHSLLTMQLEKIFITPRYAQKHATFISTVVSFNDTSMYFGPIEAVEQNFLKCHLFLQEGLPETNP